MYDLKVESLTR